MNPTVQASMIINHQLPFGYLYILALVLLAALLVYAGIRQRYPLSTLSVVVGFNMVMFVAGMRMFSYPLREWPAIFASGDIHLNHIIYLPGGLIFAAVGLVVLKRFLELRGSLLDSVILGLPFIGIVQRIDCLVNGCCYGKPTGLPWAIQYPVSTGPWQHFLEKGYITGASELSPGIHPTQLYYILGYILVIFILLRFRNKAMVPGNLALAGFLLLGLMRFIIEYFREPASSRWFYFTWLGMDSLQWVLLPLLVISAVLLFRREKYFFDRKTRIAGTTREDLFRNSMVLLLSALILWNTGKLLDRFEYILLLTLLFSSIIMLASRIFLKRTVPSYRIRILVSITITVVAMSQTDPGTQTKQDTTGKAKQWLSFGGGIGGGAYDRINYNCSGEETSRAPATYNTHFFGIEYNIRNNKGKQFQAGLNYIGMRQDYSDVDEYDFPFMQGITPYMKAELKHFGIGAGYGFTTRHEWAGLPRLSLRIGSRDKYFVDANLMENFPLMGISGVWQLGVGSGFGKLDSHQVRVGISSVEGKTIGYLSGSFLLRDRFALSTNLGFGNKIHGSLGLQYQLPIGGKTSNSKH